MDPERPDDEEEHGHEDVELRQGDLTRRQEALRVLLLNVDLQEDRTFL